MKNYLFLFVIFLVTNTVKAQDFYSTKNGHLIMQTKVNEQNVKFQSHNLQVLLDYETADITIIIDPSTLKTGIDSIDSNLIKKVNNEIHFKGSLGLDYINTESHPSQEFNIEGFLECNNNRVFIKGNGVLEHLYSNGEYACMLNISFNLKDDKLNCFEAIAPMKEGLHIEILQAVLQHRGDKY
ncbi:MAG: hypothetical protein GXO79_15170 [Chlorobi bacterium]|nr:hypothetical protein [Chlorobiota bacterium]